MEQILRWLPLILALGAAIMSFGVTQHRIAALEHEFNAVITPEGMQEYGALKAKVVELDGKVRQLEAFREAHRDRHSRVLNPGLRGPYEER